MDRYKIHNIEAVVDRVLLRRDTDPEEDKLFLSRLTDSIETALKFGDGYLIVQDVTDASAPHDMYFSEHLACPEHGSVLPEIEPRTFSFNTPHGACPDCQGLGGKLEIDAEILIPDSNLSLKEGAIAITEWSGPKEEGGYYWQTLEAAAEFTISTCVFPSELPQENWKSFSTAREGDKSPSLIRVFRVINTPSSVSSKA
jgi:excinuclease ABC subunit A